jgi:hypothetical protein
MSTIIIASIVLTVFAIYGIWRHRQTAEALERFANFVPPKNRLSWNIWTRAEAKRGDKLELPSSDHNCTMPDESNLNMTARVLGRPDLEGIDFLNVPLNFAATADGIVAGAFIADAALQIDPQVLQALEFSTAEHLRSLADIDSYAQAHFFDAPIPSAEGWFERLTGYVAEQKAATAIEQLGHHVEFAPVANQPVWDLLVDGHQVQIKEGIAGVKDFVLHHPGIDVFTSPDVATAINNSSVHALDVLDKDSIQAATEQSLNGVDGVMDPSFHIPFITTAFSSYREAKLLWNEKTTFGRALKNVGMDVAGVGGGAWMGSHAGGMVGSVLGPFGTVVGAVGGTVVGAIIGKLASTGVRKAPFKQAREDYDVAVSNAQSAFELEMSRSRQRISELQVEYQQKFIEERKKVEESARQRVGEIRIKFENDLLDFCEHFPAFLRDLKTQLRREEQEVLSSLPSRGFSAWVIASDDALRRSVVKAWFKQARKLVDIELRVFGEIAPRTVDTLYTEIQRFLNEYEFELASLANELGSVRERFESAEEQTERVRTEAAAEVILARRSLIHSFGQRIRDLHERIVVEIQSWNGSIAYKKLVLKREAAAIGIEI